MPEIGDFQKFNEETLKSISEFYGVDLSEKPIVTNFESHSADFIKQFEPKLAEMRNKLGEILYSKFLNMKTEQRVDEIFILINIAKMTLTEINTLTDKEREMLALKFYNQAKFQDELMRKGFKS